MSPKEFTECMNILISVYGDQHFRSGRLDAWNGILCQLRFKDARDLVSQITENMRQAPMPQDGRNAVIEYKKQYRIKHGKHYDDLGDIEVQSTRIDCADCYDGGTVWVRFHESKPGDDKLMRCKCDAGINHYGKLPQWDYGIKAVYLKIPIDPLWFKPKDYSGEEKEKVQDLKFKSKIEEWSFELKKSEKYWKDMGYNA